MDPAPLSGRSGNTGEPLALLSGSPGRFRTLLALRSSRTSCWPRPRTVASWRRRCSILPVRSLTYLEHGRGSWLSCGPMDTLDTGVVWISRESLHRIWRECSRCACEKQRLARFFGNEPDSCETDLAINLAPLDRVRRRNWPVISPHSRRHRSRRRNDAGRVGRR